MNIFRALPTIMSTEDLEAQKVLATALKSQRHKRGIGSKYLWVVMIESQAILREWPDFVHLVESNQIIITPEIEELWRRTTDKIAAEIDMDLAPPRANPCSLCGTPTNSWFEDICRPCFIQAARECRKTNL